MENVVLGWAETQSWWHVVTTIVVIANAVTMTLKDKYAESLPIIGRLCPILNWLSLNIGHNENNEKK